MFARQDMHSAFLLYTFHFIIHFIINAQCHVLFAFFENFFACRLKLPQLSISVSSYPTLKCCRNSIIFRDFLFFITANIVAVFILLYIRLKNLLGLCQNVSNLKNYFSSSKQIFELV